MSNETFITLFMIGMLVLVFAVAVIAVPNFYLPQNMLNLLANNWFIVIVGIGVTFLLVTGNFDMSVGGVIALTGVLSVYFCQGANVSQNVLANGLGLPYGVAIALALLCAMGIGGDQCVLRCPAEGALHHRHAGHGDARTRHRPGRHPGRPEKHQPARCIRRPGNVTIPCTSIKISVLIMIVLVVVAFIFEKKTVPGRRTYLIGANSEAARLSGVKVTRHLTSLFILSALLAGITGILLASEFKAGVSNRATGYEFDALVVGSAGRRQHQRRARPVLGMFVGAIILSVVTSASTGLLLSPDWQFILKGVVTFVAILAQRFALERRKV